jgi:hypothetical protein
MRAGLVEAEALIQVDDFAHEHGLETLELRSAQHRRHHGAAQGERKQVSSVPLGQLEIHATQATQVHEQPVLDPVGRHDASAHQLGRTAAATVTARVGRLGLC